MNEYNNHSELIKRIAVIVTIIFFIIGIIGGFIFKTVTIESAEYSFMDDIVIKKFNWAIAFGIWLYAAVQALGFYIVYAHLDNQETQIALLDKINEKIKQDN